MTVLAACPACLLRALNRHNDALLWLDSNGDDSYGEVFVLAITVSDQDGPLYQWFHPRPRGDVSPYMGGRCHSMVSFGGALSAVC